MIAPADEVSHGADAEDDEVTCLLALEAHEDHLGGIRIVEQGT